MAYEGQLEDDEDDFYDDGTVDCEFCGEPYCGCDIALDCRCGAYQVLEVTGRFIKIADCCC